MQQEIKEIIKPENLVYRKTPLDDRQYMHYCPGCGHSTTHRILAEISRRKGSSRMLSVYPCRMFLFLYHNIDIDWHEAAHGRAPALSNSNKEAYAR
jgi:2-oxoglutarate ferredoxin oxidoreductase subunit beta